MNNSRSRRDLLLAIPFHPFLLIGRTYPSHAEYAASSVTVTHPNETKEKRVTESGTHSEPAINALPPRLYWKPLPLPGSLEPGILIVGSLKPPPKPSKLELLFRIAITGPRRVRPSSAVAFRS
jgi:hypothetical protein